MIQENALAGRSALITGGGTGLGLALARELGGGGARLVLASRSEEHLEEGRRRLEAEGAEVQTVVTDVRDYRQVRRAVQVTVDRYGGLDILVNNAAGNFIRAAEDLPEKAFSTVVDIVLNGTFYASRAAGRAMIAAGRGGALLNIVATYAWHGGPGTAHSAAAKAGVLALTRTLAVEWARHGIRVNALAPGAFESEGASDRLWPDDELRERVRRAIPLGRFAGREEIARAGAWLCSDEAAYVTGEVLVVDGGAWLGRGVAGLEPSEGIPRVRRRRRGDGEG
jgi:NAD(P)-dependent dehydrogenase (short-subunit alcohol dehydrogenase family)